MTNTELIRQEIDRLQEAQLDKCRNFSSGYNEGIFAGLSMLERFIDSLQQEQPEVELNFQVFAKEMDAVFNLPKEVTENTEENPLNWEYAIARHFYKLGLKARKEE